MQKKAPTSQRDQKFPAYPTSTAPPFTLKISPVIKPAYSVHKNNTGAAISSGLPARPMGIVRRIRSPTPGSSSADFDISVSTQPGQRSSHRFPPAPVPKKEFSSY